MSFSNQQGQSGIELGNPPVAETAIGFYFQRIEGWNYLASRCTVGEVSAQVSRLRISPDASRPAPPQQSIMLDLPSLPVRVGFVDKTKSQLVQTQNGLLIHNWRKTADVPDYQRYKTVRSQLREDWSTLKSYLRERSLKDPTVTRCQMDYFNHLIRGEEWQDFSDLPKTFTVWRGLQHSGDGGKLQMASFAVSYGVERGTVNIVVQPAIRTNDGKEIIQFTLSVHGSANQLRG